jgi:hypothetical protein
MAARDSVDVVWLVREQLDGASPGQVVEKPPVTCRVPMLAPLPPTLPTFESSMQMSAMPWLQSGAGPGAGACFPESDELGEVFLLGFGFFLPGFEPLFDFDEPADFDLVFALLVEALFAGFFKVVWPDLPLCLVSLISAVGPCGRICRLGFRTSRCRSA